MTNNQWAVQEFTEDGYPCDSVVKKKPKAFTESELVYSESIFDEDVGEGEVEPLYMVPEKILRAKWVMDGAGTLKEAAEYLRSYAQYLEKIEEEGWQLNEMV